MDEKSSFIKFISGLRCSKEEYESAKEYYLSSSTSIEKSQYENFCLIIGSKLFKNIIANKLGQNKGILRNHGIPEKDIIFFINAYTLSVADYKLILSFWQLKYPDFLSFYHTFYNRCAATSWHKKALEEQAKKYNISLKVLIDLIKEYKRNYQMEEDIDMSTILTIIDSSEAFANFMADNLILNAKVKWYYEFSATPVEKSAYEAKILNESNSFQKDPTYKPRNNKYFKFCTMLLNNAPFEELAAFVNSEQINFGYLTKKYLSAFKRTYIEKFGLEAGNEAFKLISTKISEFLNRENDLNIKVENNLNPEESEIVAAKISITNALYTPNGFKTESLRVGPANFTRYFNIVKKHDFALFSTYNHLSSNSNLMTKEELLKLVELINFGIMENDALRPFTILDYYLIFKIPLTRLKTYLPLLGNMESEIILNFISMNNDHIVTPEFLKSLEIAFKKDDQPSSCIYLNPFEKTKIINYLIANNIPLTKRTYEITALRYINGYTLEEKNPSLM